MRFRYVVSGRVHGVGFRWFVRERCRALHITGYVRNLETGHVEVIANGSPDTLTELEVILGKGPAGAIVTKVDKLEILDEVTKETSFHIVG